MLCTMADSAPIKELSRLFPNSVRCLMEWRVKKNVEDLDSSQKLAGSFLQSMICFKCSRPSYFEVNTFAFIYAKHAYLDKKSQISSDFCFVFP